MPDKRIILIHGRATKPTEPVKEDLVRKALISRIEKVNPAAAESIKNGHVIISLAYYGDILNRILVEKDPKLIEKKDMSEVDGIYYEQDFNYRVNMAILVKRPNDEHERKHYKKMLKLVRSGTWKDNAARIASKVFSFFRIGKRIVLSRCPDLKMYLDSRLVGSAIRDRLQPILKSALMNGEDVALVSHSMGCIVSYDVLWKFSRMSEYRDIRERKVSLWMTLGNPLGDRSVQKMLYDSNEAKDGMYPANVLRWVNITAKDDFVAHDKDVGDDFEEMQERGLVEKIEDVPPIYTFWVGRNKSNPHKFYGYLNHPEVARRLAEWIV